MTLGRSSQAQNIAASKWLTFSNFQPSRRKSRICRLSLIFATLVTPISKSVFFSVHCRFAHSSSSFSLGHFPTSRRLEPYLERLPLATILLAGARGVYALLELEVCTGLSANRNTTSLAARSPAENRVRRSASCSRWWPFHCSVKPFFHSCAAHR